MYRLFEKKSPEFKIVHYHLAIALARKGLLDETIEQFNKILAFDPDMAPAHYYIGVAYYYKGEVDRAMKHFKKAIEIEPEDKQSARNLQTLRELRGKFF